MHDSTYCGFITIVGKPNVGKSTLLNRVCGQKLSIISRKPQTTRHRITAVKTKEKHQFIFIDTPGLHRNPKHRINKLMIKTATSAMKDVDVIVLVVNPKNFSEDDEMILKRLAKYQQPVIIAINKIDILKDKSQLLSLMQMIQAKCQSLNLRCETILPISARHNEGINALENEIEKYLPPSVFMYPEGQITDRNERFLAAELIREKLMRFLGEEVPHASTVEIEKFSVEGETKKVLHIHGLIWVEREGQKKIVLGSAGEGLKHIATLARHDLEKSFNQKVYLKLWVKVKKGWTDNLTDLINLGYKD